MTNPTIVPKQTPSTPGGGIGDLLKMIAGGAAKPTSNGTTQAQTIACELTYKLAQAVVLSPNPVALRDAITELMVALFGVVKALGSNPAEVTTP